MRTQRVRAIAATVTLLSLVGAGQATLAQAEPWQVRVDPLTQVECGLINATNVRLTALADTGELVILGDDSGDTADTIIAGSFVDADGNVFLGDAEAGQVRFAEDSTNLTTLWWLAADSDLVFEYDAGLGLPFLSDATPDSLFGEVCDPCVLWDFNDFCDQPPAPITIILCGGNTMAMMLMTFAGLMTTRARRGRKRLA